MRDQGRTNECPICLPVRRLTSVTVARTFLVGCPRPLTVTVSTVGCPGCGHLRDEAEVERAICVESCRAVVLSGVVNADTFRLLRRAARLTSVETAALLRIDAGTISRWENGHRECNGRAWALLALAALDTYGVTAPPIRRILAAIDDPTPPSTVDFDLH